MCVWLFFFHLPVFWLLRERDVLRRYLQIARDCPEGREPVEEEDNTWGEIQDNPWDGGAAVPAEADGNEGML
jgi:hypothetical protein